MKALEVCTILTTNRRGALWKDKLWENGQIIRIKFLDGTKTDIEFVKRCAVEWTKHANLVFAYVDSEPSDVRITFAQPGAWSYVGKDALDVPKREPTMCLGGVKDTTDEMARTRYTLHEFGHMVGLMHEHLSPVSTIRWNEDAVLEYYWRVYGWPPDETRANVLERYDDVSIHTEYDEKSIMLYAIPKELTLDGYEVPWENSVLSALDKAVVKMAYPRERTTR